MSRQFAYHEGDYTENHVENSRLRSSPVTELVSMITLTGGRTIGYEYDAEDRIISVNDSVDGVTTYEYDALGQLVSENGARITYDNFGNITQKNGLSYQYNHPQWRDLLTNVGGQNITYDANGNPTNYLGNTLTWEKGRQLKSFVDTKYTYNASGIRTSKTVGCIRYNFVLDETKILRQSWPGHELQPVYDNEDSVCGIIHNGTPYYFHKNLQGDVIAIVDGTGSVVGNYTYDAWGKVLSATGDNIVNINPYRYRSYYYDTDTKLYYLQSRYYDPNVGRFLNTDSLMDKGEFDTGAGLLAYNVYAYCANNPVCFVDHGGNLISTAILVGARVARAVALRNFTYNHRIRHASQARVIYGQRNDNISPLRMGVNGRIHGNGCGPVAVHNAAILLGRRSNIRDVIRWFDSTAGYSFLVGGTWGTRIDSLLKYLTIVLRRRASIRFSNHENHVRNSRFAILHTINEGNVRNGLHYTLVRFNKRTNDFTTWNRFSSDRNIRTFSSFNNIIRGTNDVNSSRVPATMFNTMTIN